MRQGATPVPIPNTTVKPLPADDTRLGTARESRRLPEYKNKIKDKCLISDPYAESCQRILRDQWKAGFIMVLHMDG